MSKFKDLAGQNFGRLTAVEVVGRSKAGAAKWRCVCECGGEVVVRGGHLTGGNTKSCGCLQKDNSTTHGMRNSKIYNVWCQVKHRCDNPSNKNFSNYGGRGINYDPSWESFENFLKDMGSTYEAGLSLDRIDNNMGYCKENCRWTTWSVQNRNKRKALKSQNNFKGVRERPSGKFAARICVNGNDQYLGTFSTAVEAAVVYDNVCEGLGCGRPNGTVKTTGE